MRIIRLTLLLRGTLYLHGALALVLQTDFSLQDGAVSAMKGVAFGVDSQIHLFDLTHEIPPTTSGRRPTGYLRPPVTGRQAPFLSAWSIRASAVRVAPWC
ncbi:hypothetical protein MA13_contig00008-0031 [Edwardsiella piscicida]|nr:hypothetical protein MA13_contig00008-0031 [Edwardsiella piscicida]